MEMPAILRKDSLTRLLQGAAAGAVATLVIGFYWGGWVTGGTAKEMVQRSTSSAVVTALSPICVDKFQQSAGATAIWPSSRRSALPARLVHRKAAGQRCLAVTTPTAVARACAGMLSNSGDD
jgi:hypothetical protein